MSETTDRIKSINTTPHLCRSKAKQTALEIAAAIRPANKFYRASMSFVERIEAKVRASIREDGQDSPQQGQDTFVINRLPDYSGKSFRRLALTYFPAACGA